MRNRPADITYPTARRSQGERRFHGHAVADPYDWLGGELSAEISAWEAAQDALTDRIVGGPAREHCEAWLEKLLTRQHSFRVIERGARLFFLRDEPGRDQPALYVREGQGAPRLMFDPASLDGDCDSRHRPTVDRPKPRRTPRRDGRDAGRWRRANDHHRRHRDRPRDRRLAAEDDRADHRLARQRRLLLQPQPRPVRRSGRSHDDGRRRLLAPRRHQLQRRCPRPRESLGPGTRVAARRLGRRRDPLRRRHSLDRPPLGAVAL